MVGFQKYSFHSSTTTEHPHEIREHQQSKLNYVKKSLSWVKETKVGHLYAVIFLFSFKFINHISPRDLCGKKNPVGKLMWKAHTYKMWKKLRSRNISHPSNTTANNTSCILYNDSDTLFFNLLPILIDCIHQLCINVFFPAIA
mmetsp:Transcript_1821/g.4819  ORF Transcript_1821/g.4819 Transcript_1821/m.4819 type:complete len:143 (+) Transcript_1821:123-551(+)